MEKNWNGLPYRPISQHYHEVFGKKVYKIPVSIADDCPNRLGLKGMQTCVFCDEWGSAAREESLSLPLREQILRYKQTIGDRYKADTFLAYFQAYTSTFMKLAKIKAHIDEALSFDFVKGFIVGSRPDCISEAVLNLWDSYLNKYYVSVELGVQSFKDDQLLFLRRGHSNAQTLNSILKISRFFGNRVHLGIHLIFGLPNETDQDIKEAAEICNQLPIHSVKLHHLHVLKNTPLAEMYLQGQFTPIELTAYAERVRLFLSHLSPQIFVDRLAAYSSRWEELIAPPWTANKMLMHQHIIDHLRAHQDFQSHSYWPIDEKEQLLQMQLKHQSSAKQNQAHESLK